MTIQKVIGLISIILYWIIPSSIHAQNPIILSTDVDENGHVEIRWDIPSGDENTRYAIQRWNYLNTDGQGFDADLVIIDASDRFYVDQNSQANTQKQIYQIYTEGSQALQSEEMQTVFLYEDIDYQECDLTNTIKWTGFFDTFNPVSYKILFSTDGGNSFTLLTTLSQNDLEQVETISTYENTSTHQTPVYAYTHQELNPDQTYTYKVEAVYDINGERQTSGSNLQSRNTPAYQRPDPPKIKSVSVNENNEIEIFGEITAPGSTTINSSSIWRTNSQNPVDLSFYTDLNQTNPGNVNYTDEAVSTNETAYWYSLVLEDKCQFSIPDDPAENAHRSIFLTAEVINNEQVELNWNAYEGWTPDHYLIFRKTTTDAYIEIGSPQQTQYTDNTIADGDESGSIIYFVQAVSEDQSTGAKITASSNRVRVGFDSPFFMPNAFRPSANITKNQLFKPLSRFSPAGGYLFQIYDRWGRLLFESTDFSKGWDGKVNGNEAPQGVYLWRYSYKNSEAKTLEDKGTVMLIR
jgi:gliding motility-associated-like protein